MTLIEQLNRLAEIAPEVCKELAPNYAYEIGEYRFMVRTGNKLTAGYPATLGAIVTGRPALAWLRDALGQVIEARGWGWELRGFSPIGAIGWRYKVILMIGQDSVMADSPTEALLTALLAALGEGEG